jgi:hypothetical protein
VHSTLLAARIVELLTMAITCLDETLGAWHGCGLVALVASHK